MKTGESRRDRVPPEFVYVMKNDNEKHEGRPAGVIDTDNGVYGYGLTAAEKERLSELARSGEDLDEETMTALYIVIKITCGGPGYSKWVRSSILSKITGVYRHYTDLMAAGDRPMIKRDLIPLGLGGAAAFTAHKIHYRIDPKGLYSDGPEEWTVVGRDRASVFGFGRDADLNPMCKTVIAYLSETELVRIAAAGAGRLSKGKVGRNQAAKMNAMYALIKELWKRRPVGRTSVEIPADLLIAAAGANYRKYINILTAGGMIKKWSGGRGSTGRCDAYAPLTFKNDPAGCGFVPVRIRIGEEWWDRVACILSPSDSGKDNDTAPAPSGPLYVWDDLVSAGTAGRYSRYRLLDAPGEEPSDGRPDAEGRIYSALTRSSKSRASRLYRGSLRAFGRPLVEVYDIPSAVFSLMPRMERLRCDDADRMAVWMKTHDLYTEAAAAMKTDRDSAKETMQKWRNASAKTVKLTPVLSAADAFMSSMWPGLAERVRKYPAEKRTDICERADGTLFRRTKSVKDIQKDYTIAETVYIDNLQSALDASGVMSWRLHDALYVIDTDEEKAMAVLDGIDWLIRRPAVSGMDAAGKDQSPSVSEMDAVTGHMESAAGNDTGFSFDSESLTLTCRLTEGETARLRTLSELYTAPNRRKAFLDSLTSVYAMISVRCRHFRFWNIAAGMPHLYTQIPLELLRAVTARYARFVSVLESAGPDGLPRMIETAGHGRTKWNAKENRPAAGSVMTAARYRIAEESGYVTGSTEHEMTVRLNPAYRDAVVRLFDGFVTDEDGVVVREVCTDPPTPYDMDQLAAANTLTGIRSYLLIKDGYGQPVVAEYGKNDSPLLEERRIQSSFHHSHPFIRSFNDRSWRGSFRAFGRPLVEVYDIPDASGDGVAETEYMKRVAAEVRDAGVMCWTLYDALYVIDTDVERARAALDGIDWLIRRPAPKS